MRYFLSLKNVLVRNSHNYLMGMSIQKEKMSPELKKIISQRSDAVRASSMDSLLGLDGESLLPELEDSLDKEDLSAQVKEIMSLDVYQEVMKKQLGKITDKKSKAGETSRMEAAKGLGMMDPSSPLTDSLSKLLRDESPDVLSCAIESAGKLKRKDFVPLVISRLNTASVHHDSCRSLIAYGTKILGTLKDYLSDPDESLRLRKSIPDIMAQIGTQRAADLLSLELKKRSKDLDEEIIEAMYKMRSKNPKLQFQENIKSILIIRGIFCCNEKGLQVGDSVGTHSSLFLQITYCTKLLRTILKPLRCESRQVLEVDYPVAVVIFTYREACIRNEVVIFRLANIISGLWSGTTVASDAGSTAASPWFLRKSYSHPYLLSAFIRMP